MLYSDLHIRPARFAEFDLIAQALGASLGRRPTFVELLDLRVSILLEEVEVGWSQSPDEPKELVAVYRVRTRPGAHSRGPTFGSVVDFIWMDGARLCGGTTQAVHDETEVLLRLLDSCRLYLLAWETGLQGRPKTFMTAWVPTRLADVVLNLEQERRVDARRPDLMGQEISFPYMLWQRTGRTSGQRTELIKYFIPQ